MNATPRMPSEPRMARICMVAVWSLNGPSQRAIAETDAKTATEIATGTDDAEADVMSAMNAVSVVTLPATADIDAALVVTVLIVIEAGTVVVTEAVTAAVIEAVIVDVAVTDVIPALTLVVTRDHRPEATASTQDIRVAIPDPQSAIADHQLTDAPDREHDHQRDSALQDLHAAIAARQRTVATAAPRQRAMATDTGPTATRQRADVTADPQATERTVPMATRMDMPMAVRRWRTATTNKHTELTSAYTPFIVHTPQLLLFY